MTPSFPANLCVGGNGEALPDTPVGPQREKVPEMAKLDRKIAAWIAASQAAIDLQSTARKKNRTAKTAVETRRSASPA